VARRATYARTISEADSASVLQLDCGDLIGAKGTLDEVRARYLIESFDKMGLDCVNFGSSDALLGQKFLLGEIRKTGIPLISANTFYSDTGERFLVPYIIKRLAPKRFLGIEWGGLRVGVFGVVQPLDETSGLPWDRDSGEHRLVPKDPAVVAREMVEELRPKVDLIVCLAHTGWVQARALAKNVSGIDLMIVGNGANVKGEPYVVNHIPLVMPGDEGKYLGVVDLYLDENKKVVKVEGHAQELDDSIEDDPEMADLVKRFNDELQVIGEKIVPATSQLDVKKFLGAEVCAECHIDEYRQWKSTRHAVGLESLVKEKQDYNPNCLKCHVTGYGFFNGFHSYEKTPGMVNVQCESCHGSGSDHVQWARGEPVSDPKREEALKYLFAPTVERCLGCHDSENDPDFDFPVDIMAVRHEPVK
jgi:hypothetical protein